jgi:sugar phosphate isomerase/epimerase
MSYPSEISRRTLLGAAALVAASQSTKAAPAPSSSGGLRLSIFSKHLQFLQGEALAQATADLGLDGIDLAVRKGGHIEPDVAAKELPNLVKILRSHKLEVPMITTDIVDVDTPHAEELLRTMQELGIRNYRWGGFKYDYTKPMAPQLEALKPRVAKLAALNKRYDATAMYHTHSGIGVVGASIWDLHIVLKEFDPAAVGVNYDIGHATIEGGYGGWINSFYITGKHMRGIAVKDCIWEKDAKGKWKSEFVPMGTGMVQFPEFFKMVKQSGFNGPLQIHYEYPLGGANTGKTKLTMPREEVLAAMKKDVQQTRAYMQVAGV